jgi:glycogen debranching enzyme
MPEKSCIALALDGDDRKCDVVSSNAGHLLFTGILDDDKAPIVADALMRPDMFCGWGIRTLSASESADNPMSYHNGSVWPHDSALIASGLCRVRRVENAQAVLKGLLDAAACREDFRLPELFCGFSRDYGKKPVWYPVSCSPQAWAAGSVFQVLASCLGLKPDAEKGVLHVYNPSLPEWLDSVKIAGLKVAGAKVDLAFEKRGDKTICTVKSIVGAVAVSVSGEDESGSN